MIGVITLGPTPNAPEVVRMEDDGTYTAADELYGPMAEYCNLTYSPMDNRLPGDSANPFGWAALARAAKFAGMPVRFATHLQPLPTGALN